MFVKMLEPAPTPAQNSTAWGTDLDLVRLLALREIEASGPQIGLDAINHVASTTRLLGISRPGYALLHDLAEEGFLAALPGVPRRYRITDLGVGEAESLAQRCWPRLCGEVAQLTRRLAPASPRGLTETSFVSEWVEDWTDGLRAKGH